MRETDHVLEDSGISVVLVDDQAAVREGLRMRLSLEPDMRVVGEAADGPTAMRLAHELAPDVMVLDLAMPGMDGFSVLQALPEASPRTRAVVLSLYDDADARTRASALGVREFVAKHEASERLIAAIRGAAKHTDKRT